MSTAGPRGSGSGQFSPGPERGEGKRASVRPFTPNDIGSGPTEAGCKVVGAEEVTALRAVYPSGAAFWDEFWDATTKRRAA
ncbi:MAG TPA: hypothetical protein VH092_14790 [Urbifossiella sp.]|nr:hypothetical protein [Urbifossiella sp.]